MNNNNNVVVVEWFLLDNFKMVARKLNYIASFTCIKKHFNKHIDKYTVGSNHY